MYVDGGKIYTRVLYIYIYVEFQLKFIIEGKWSNFYIDTLLL